MGPSWIAAPLESSADEYCSRAWVVLFEWYYSCGSAKRWTSQSLLLWLISVNVSLQMANIK